MADNIHIGSRIKQEMLNANMTVKDITEYLHLSRTAVYDIFKKEDVNTSVLRELSTLFNIPMSVFVEEYNSHSSTEINKILIACRDLKNEHKQFDKVLSKLFKVANLK